MRRGAYIRDTTVYAQSCIQPGFDYFVNWFTGELSSQLEAFKAARLFVPHKVVHMCPDASSVDSLRAFPFLKSDILIANLKTYLGRASNVAAEVDPLPWWSQQISDLPTWVSAFRQVLLIQPSSAAAEKYFHSSQIVLVQAKIWLFKTTLNHP